MNCSMKTLSYLLPDWALTAICRVANLGLSHAGRIGYWSLNNDESMANEPR